MPTAAAGPTRSAVRATTTSPNGATTCARSRRRCEIVVARYAGYCYGVERALRITEEALEGAEGPVATLGPIIHNPTVVAQLEERGVDVVDDRGQAWTPAR